MHSESILATKLNAPRCAGGLVHRQRLFDKFGSEIRAVNLVCAPTGFGKTTLLSSWLRQSGLPVAWLSLDENDSEPIRFMRYIIASIQSLFPDFGRDVMAILGLPQPVNIISLLQMLLNQIAANEQHYFLALDDYHVIEDDTIHEIMNFLIAHQPVQLHLAITTRVEPPLALSRQRVRRQIVEISELDLRFNQQETAQFFNQTGDLNLSAHDIEILEARTEGWIAGLQLAALSLEAEEDRTSFIQAFAGDDRYIMDYLTDEVLQRQPEETKRFLLQTSLLERLCGSLCNKITGGSQGAQLLEQLERSNMFVIPLDNKRQWYRYHQLFADLLRTQLTRDYPEEFARIHHLASEWFNENGLPHEAITHAFEIDDFEQVLNVLEKHGQRLFEDGQAPLLMEWYKRLPNSIIQNNPC